jgi:hypothetical protein
MSESSISEYLKVQRERYQRRRGRGARSALLDECAAVTGHERKHLIKIMGMKRPVSGEQPPGGLERRGRPSRYGEVSGVIKGLWLASEQPCGKRLRTVLRDWLPYWEREHGALSAGHRKLVRTISAAQIDRLLAAHRSAAGGRPRRAAASAALKAQVPLRTGPWAVSEPGWMELDSVAHCGGSMSGNFWWTVVMTDICSGWTEQQPAWNKGQHATSAAIREMEKHAPFPVRGADTDNGPEFLNWHLLEHWRGRTPAVEVTRSRPYHKNDNAHVEQKNRTHVRELLGEGRLDEAGLAPLLERLDRVWSDLHNMYLPTLKLTGKERRAGKIKKRYEAQARTPCQRLLEDAHITGAARIALLARRSALNPLRLKEEAERLLGEIWELQHRAGVAVAAETAGGAAPVLCAVHSGCGGSLPAPASPCAPRAEHLRAS